MGYQESTNGLDKESIEISDILEEALRIWNGHNPNAPVRIVREDGAFVANYYDASRVSKDGKGPIAKRNVLIITGNKTRTRDTHGNQKVR